MNDLRARIREAIAPGSPLEVSGPMAWLRWSVGITRHFLRRFHDNNIMALSAALSFRTIFALIPILVLAFLSARSLGVLEDGKNSLRQFLDASGFSQIAAVREDPPIPLEGPLTTDTQPATPELEEEKPIVTPSGDVELINLADKIEEVVTSVESKLTFDRLGPIGSVLLIYTAITLLQTVERSLNRIFAAPNDRPLGRSLLLYWAAITFGPLLVSVAAYLGQRGLETVEHSFSFGIAAILLGAVSSLGPMVVGVLVLALIYERLPTASVRFRAALAGALVAVALWLAAKWGFSVYVQQFVLPGNLYGVLGLLPLFLLWINFSWLIFLFGAEIAHVLDDPGQLRQLHDADPALIGPSDFLAALVVVAQRFETGRSPATENEIGAQVNLSTKATRRVLRALENGRFILRGPETDPPQYTLARAPDLIAVDAVLALGDPRRPVGAAARDDQQPPRKLSAYLVELENVAADAPPAHA